jgi:hypothetical protein
VLSPAPLYLFCLVLPSFVRINAQIDFFYLDYYFCFGYRLLKFV